MLLGSHARKGLEPVSEVSGSFFHRPVSHLYRNGFRHFFIEFRVLLLFMNS